ncbi:hypothetical protein AB0L63_24445 [Nocardia sp. NPDC051990]|uniref:hypothetical protein n=1 Tax=Nocardia sp. NPDC051990 TaxID=3155285 RepID=UPI00343544BF
MGRANAYGPLGFGARDLESVARDPAARMMQSIADADARNLAGAVDTLVHGDLRDLDLHREVRHFVARSINTDTGRPAPHAAPSPRPHRTARNQSFTHVAGTSARVADLGVSMAAVLCSQAMNVGLVPETTPGSDALTRGVRTGAAAMRTTQARPPAPAPSGCR